MEYFTPAKENELQLDLDTALARRTFKRRFAFLKTLHHIKVQSVRKYISRSGNQHVSILLSHPLPIMERIALQCALGSDPIRELYNWGRAKNNAPFPIVFLHPRPRTCYRVTPSAGV